MKRRLPIPAIIGIVVGAAVTLCFTLSIIIYPINKKLNPPPAPVVQYAEFPYKIVYEKDGEQFTVEDTLIIEFVDSAWSFELGDVYEWNRYRLSERPSVTQGTVVCVIFVLTSKNILFQPHLRMRLFSCSFIDIYCVFLL